MAITKIATVEVGAGGAASIDFTSIPGTYTDLMVVCSLRTSRSATDDAIVIKFNGSSTGFSARELRGTGSATNSNAFTSGFGGFIDGSTATANTFSNNQIYIPNYAGATNKSFSLDGVTENNAASALQGLIAGLWSNTAAITQVTLTPDTGPNWVQYSSATLYGISKTGATGATVA